eukprot:TRINITY_DN5708_c0_g1_i3.p1 TRINITY_DN5708_c0_g1~~TRINITY_DN5708_c0_g1_i3.p1  ORF type:complete len:110 (+),score=7.57 TRINITY_DN5708_c0_g1_i3:452-781(+)
MAQLNETISTAARDLGQQMQLEYDDRFDRLSTALAKLTVQILRPLDSRFDQEVRLLLSVIQSKCSPVGDRVNQQSLRQSERELLLACLRRQHQLSTWSSKLEVSPLGDV